jgi:hypothetical protein
MVEAFRRCAGHLEKFGGHEHAGGLSIKKEQFTAFCDAFEGTVRECLTPEDLLPLLEIDASLKFSEIGFPLMRELDLLKPLGSVILSRCSTRGEVCDSKLFPAVLAASGREHTPVVSPSIGEILPRFLSNDRRSTGQ